MSARPTTFIEAERLGERLGVRLTLASETFQRTGSFKFRAAWSVASRGRSPAESFHSKRIRRRSPSSRSENDSWRADASAAIAPSTRS